jgi:hypothetical protein
VTEVEVILSFVILISTAIMLGSVGIYFSAHIKRTLTASMTTYGVALFVTFVMPVLVGILLALANGIRTPSSTLNSVLVDLIGLLVSTNPLATAIATEGTLINNPQTGLLAPMSVRIGYQYYPFPPPWILFTLIYLILSAVMVTLAVRRVRRIEA